MSQQYGQLISVPKPFLKWAGGKRQLIPMIKEYLPKIFETYHEPFLGGGALLFHILYKNPRKGCSVSDLNSNLITAYTTLRDNVEEVIESLKFHAKNYFKDSRSYYYSIRQTNPKGRVEKTARLIFLNRTCFNGLYRVNSKGKFNVPLGRYINPNIVNEENLRVVSRILKSRDISIQCKDFALVLDQSRENDFVYFDPPYHPISKTSNFTSYTHQDFGIDDLQRLAKTCNALDDNGCKVLLSNSDSPEVFNLFSKKKWNIVKMGANRSINSDSKKRKGHYELLIKNY